MIFEPVEINYSTTSGSSFVPHATSTRTQICTHTLSNDLGTRHQIVKANVKPRDFNLNSKIHQFIDASYSADDFVRSSSLSLSSSDRVGGVARYANNISSNNNNHNNNNKKRYAASASDISDVSAAGVSIKSDPHGTFRISSQGQEVHVNDNKTTYMCVHEKKTKSTPDKIPAGTGDHFTTPYYYLSTPSKPTNATTTTTTTTTTRITPSLTKSSPSLLTTMTTTTPTPSIVDERNNANTNINHAQAHARAHARAHYDAHARTHVSVHGAHLLRLGDDDTRASNNHSSSSSSSNSSNSTGTVKKGEREIRHTRFATLPERTLNHPAGVKTVSSSFDLLSGRRRLIGHNAFDQYTDVDALNKQLVTHDGGAVSDNSKSSSSSSSNSSNGTTRSRGRRFHRADPTEYDIINGRNKWKE